MVTGDHVEVFREAVAAGRAAALHQALPGHRRRATSAQWTEREWRILARLVGHGIEPVPDVVQFDRGATDRPALVQTYDAGVTVDHWATLLPVQRDGDDPAHTCSRTAPTGGRSRGTAWSRSTRSTSCSLVHLDLKADNVCIPVGPADFDPHARGAARCSRASSDIALIDFAFSLVSGERLESALPIAQQADYDYQSPRLLRALEDGRHGDLAPTRQLDWRCDLFSLAAMLWRYLPEPDDTTDRRAGRGRATPRRARWCAA